MRGGTVLAGRKDLKKQIENLDEKLKPDVITFSSEMMRQVTKRQKTVCKSSNWLKFAEKKFKVSVRNSRKSFKGRVDKAQFTGQLIA